MTVALANRPLENASPADAAPAPSQSAISEWPDVDTLYRRFAELVQQPMRPIKPEGMARVMRYFEERCQGSKRLAEAAKQVIPGGVQHNLAFNYPFPLAMAQASGAHLDRRGRQPLHRLSASRRADAAGLQSSGGARRRSNELLDSAGRSPACCTSTR